MSRIELPVKIETKVDYIFLTATLIAFLTFQGTYLLLILFCWFSWEDARWPAFDSKNYDQKMMYGPLKPWRKGR